jgi:Ca-activated chloride channel family protein
MRGAVYDESGKGISNVKIFLLSKGATAFYTGITGSFAIPVSVTLDTIMLQASGYETIKQLADVSRFQVFTMKPVSASATASQLKPKLISLIPRNKNESLTNYFNSGETYSSLVEHDFTNAEKFPETGFALNVDRASYSNIRRFLNSDMKVLPDAVRIEEMLNYFDLDHRKNITKNFTCTSQITEAPWNTKNELLFINIKAPSISLDDIPPANLIFLIDISGSMDQPNRLPLLKDAFKMLVNNLRRPDTVAIVVYGGWVGTYLRPISCMYKDSIKNLIERLNAGGETPGEAAIRTAYRLAEKMYNKKANNRIILATDGDFNVGQTSDKELEDIVLMHRQSGIYLTCLGVGMGNYKDSKLEALANKGNGNFAYLDNIGEAEKVLVKEFTKTLYAVADDAYTEITFDPQFVKRYRLIGFDNKADAEADSTSELEGGEVGMGHSFTAVFEIVPAQYNDSSSATKNIAQLTLHYKPPGKDANVVLPFSIPNNFRPFANADSSVRFATALVMFGGLLKQSLFWKNYSWDDLIQIAKASADINDFSQTEFLAIAEKAKNIYVPVKKKRKDKGE